MKNCFPTSSRQWFILSGVLALLVLALQTAPAAPATPAPSATSAAATAGPAVDAVAKAYQTWLNTVANAKGNPATVLKLYAPDAILVATYSPTLLHNDNGELADYFKKFTALPKLTGTTQDLQTRVYGDFAINTGLYTFTYETPDSEKVVVPARFTFVYRRVGDQWQIVDHHSSVVPIAL